MLNKIFPEILSYNEHALLRRFIATVFCVVGAILLPIFIIKVFLLSVAVITGINNYVFLFFTLLCFLIGILLRVTIRALWTLSLLELLMCVYFWCKITLFEISAHFELVSIVVIFFLCLAVLFSDILFYFVVPNR